MATKYWHPTGGAGTSAWEGANWNTVSDGSGDYSTLAETDVAIFTHYDETACTTSGAVACAGLTTVGGTGVAADDISAPNAAPTALNTLVLTLGGNMTVNGAVLHQGGKIDIAGYKLTCASYMQRRNFTNQPSAGSLDYTPQIDGTPETCEVSVAGDIAMDVYSPYTNGSVKFDGVAQGFPANHYPGRVNFTQTATGRVGISAGYDSTRLSAVNVLKLAWGAGVVSSISGVGMLNCYAAKIMIGEGSVDCQGYLTVRFPRADDGWVDSSTGGTVTITGAASHVGITGNYLTSYSQGNVTVLGGATPGMLLILSIADKTVVCTGRWSAGTNNVHLYNGGTLTINSGTLVSGANCYFGKNGTTANTTINVNGNIYSTSAISRHSGDSSTHTVAVGATGVISAGGTIATAGCNVTIASGGLVGRVTAGSGAMGLGL